MLLGVDDGDRFGRDVGCADVNADGHPDLLVGVPGAEGGGAMNVYYGGPTFDPVVDLTFADGMQPLYGTEVGSVGDFNGDGFEDFGAVEPDDEGMFVYHGGPTVDTTVDFDRPIRGIVALGDVNGDGFDDILGRDLNQNEAHVLLGFDSGGRQHSLVLDEPIAGIGFADALGAGGDLNGDGFPDFAIGAPADDQFDVDAGRVYVYHGAPELIDVPAFEISGRLAGDGFGEALTIHPDLNGDGFGDLVVGSGASDVAGLDAGRVDVFFGGPDMNGEPDLTWFGSPGDRLGDRVGSGGDHVGDGFADVLLARPDVGEGRVGVMDLNRFHLDSPTGGETWNVGSLAHMFWKGAETADIELSLDGGSTYRTLLSGVGGSPSNHASVRVPHLPTRFAELRLVPSDPSVGGEATTNASFTIEASIALLRMRASPGDAGGVLLSWETEPGPDDLAGYKVERSPVGPDVWTVLTSLIRETVYHDPGGTVGMRYRLVGINGLGEEQLLGETVFGPRATLAAWPLPYRGGDLNVSFATSSGRGGGAGAADVSVYDVRGRHVRTIARGVYEAGYRSVTWDGQDESGNFVPGGVYFLRALSAGASTQLRLVVVR